MIAMLFLLKASFVMVAAGLVILCVKHRVSAATRHWLYMLAICGLLALPLLSALLPGWTVLPLLRPTTNSLAVQGPNSAAGQTPIDSVKQRLLFSPAAGAGATATLLSSPRLARGTRWMSWPMWGLLFYVGGVVLLISRLVVEHIRVRRLVRRGIPLDSPAWQIVVHDSARQLGVRCDVPLMFSTDLTTPAAVGLRRPTIIIPAAAAQWPDEVRRAVLIHELAHVARRDCLTQAAAAVACALYWVHPGTWWMARRLRMERELACDDLVVGMGINRCDYAGHLLTLARHLSADRTPALAVGMAAPHQVETRLLALLDHTRNRAPVTRQVRAAGLAALLALMVPMAVATADPAQADGGSTRTMKRAVSSRFSAENLGSMLTIDYWRHSFADQLHRLSEQMQFVRDMQQLGYSPADPNVLFTLRQHGVTPTFVRALAAQGLTGLSSDDLLTAADHGVTAAYVAEMNALGYRSLDIAQLTHLRDRGVDGRLVRELGDVGFVHLPLEALVVIQRHGITPPFIGELQTLGYRALTLDDLVLLRSHGVEPSFIRAFQALGYVDISPASLALLLSHGVTPTDAQSANETAGDRLTITQLTSLASRGWGR